MSLYFLFVQFDFTHAVGPHAAKYVVEPELLSVGQSEGAEASTPQPSLDPWLDERNRELAGTTRGIGGSDVLVVGVLAAPAARPRLLRRTRPVDPQAPPEPVALSRITYVRGSRPFTRTEEARRELQAIQFEEARQRQWVRAGLHVLNLAIRGYRAGAPDPYAIEVTRRDARSIRIGWGDSEEVQNGRCHEAVALPPLQQPKATRIQRLRPAEAVAAVLSARTRILESEDLLLRCLVDLDHGRTRAAAGQLAAATRLLPHELRDRPGADGLDYAGLERAATTAESLAHVADERPLTPPETAELERLLDALAGTIDAWRYRQVEG